MNKSKTWLIFIVSLEEILIRIYQQILNDILVAKTSLKNSTKKYLLTGITAILPETKE